MATGSHRFIARKRPANRPSPLTIFVMMDVGASAGRLVPGQEFADAIDRMIGDAGENVPQISLRIEPIHLGGLKEGIHPEDRMPPESEPANR